MTDTELLPCPFCGAAHAHAPIDFGGGIFYRTCEDCGAAGPGEKSIAEADAAWNRRAHVGSGQIATVDRRVERRAYGFDEVRRLFYEFCEEDGGKTALVCIGEFLGEWEHNSNDPAPLTAAAHARGAAEERAAVVAFLDLKRRMDPVELGRCIARGEHRREGGG